MNDATTFMIEACSHVLYEAAQYPQTHLEVVEPRSACPGMTRAGLVLIVWLFPAPPPALARCIVPEKVPKDSFGYSPPVAIIIKSLIHRPGIGILYVKKRA